MDITVALDGSLERNLVFPPGDDMTLSLTVYALDGDTTPLAVTNPQLSTGGGGYFPIGSQFTITCGLGRTPYRIAVDIAGVTTTVAYGYIESPYPCAWSYNCCLCYDGCLFPAVIPTMQATNVLVSDSGGYFTADNAEDILAEIAVRLQAGGL
jgi:hypothetical protein